MTGDGDVFSSLSFGGMSGSTNMGLLENALSHPANGVFVAPGYTKGYIGTGFVSAGTSLAFGATRTGTGSQGDPYVYTPNRGVL